MNIDELDLEHVPAAGDSFWDTLYKLRLKGTMCDIELTVHGSDNTVIIIPAHKLVLVGASTYFQAALERDDLLDVYNFDGINALDLQMVLDYVYHQKTWDELVAQPEAAVAANVLGIKRRAADKEPPPKLFRSKQGKNFLVVPVEPTRCKRKASSMAQRTGGQRVMVDDVEDCFQKSLEYSKAEMNNSKMSGSTSENPGTSALPISESVPVQESSVNSVVNFSTPSTLSSQQPGSFVMLQNLLQSSAVTTFTHTVTGVSGATQDSHSQLALLADASVSMENLENAVAAEALANQQQLTQEVIEGTDTEGNIVYIMKDSTTQSEVDGAETQLHFIQTDTETHATTSEYLQQGQQVLAEVTYQEKDVSEAVAENDLHQEPTSEVQQEEVTQIPIKPEPESRRVSTRSSSNKAQPSPVTQDLNKEMTQNKQVTVLTNVPQKRGRGRPRKYALNKYMIPVKPIVVEPKGAQHKSPEAKVKASEISSETPGRYSTRRKTFTLPEALRPLSAKKVKVEKDDSDDCPQTINPQSLDNNECKEEKKQEEKDNATVSDKNKKAEPEVAPEEVQTTEDGESDMDETDFPNIFKPEIPDEETDECEELLDDEVEPNEQKATSQDAEQLYYPCTKCNRRFKSPTGLAIHDGWSHGDNWGESAEATCSDCGAKFKGPSALSVHMRRIHKKAQMHKCNQEGCDQEFCHIRDFRKHLVDVHSITSFYCEICEVSFKSPEGLKIHMIKKHTEVDPTHMCDLCGKVFKMKHELARHVNITHSVEKYKCHLCERAFKSRSSLKRHIRTFHSSTRNFQCDVCPSMFKTLTDMKKHRVLHFREINPLRTDRARSRTTEEVLRPCKYCGKHFSRKCNLEHHEARVHEAKEKGLNYLCSICQKTFSVQAYLQQHILAKHRPRRFRCASCGASFTQRYMLNRHLPRCKCIPKHLKPFRCSVCGAAFLNKRNLQLHSEQPKRCAKYLERNKGEIDPVDFVIYMKSEEGVGGGEVPIGETAATQEVDMEQEQEENGEEEQGDSSSQSQLYQIVEDTESGHTRLIQIGDNMLEVQQLPDETRVILQTVEGGDILHQGDSGLESMVASQGGGDIHMTDDKGVVLHVVESGEEGIVTEFGDGSHEIVTQIQVPYND